MGLGWRKVQKQKGAGRGPPKVVKGSKKDSRRKKEGFRRAPTTNTGGKERKKVKGQGRRNF